MSTERIIERRAVMKRDTLEVCKLAALWVVAVGVVSTVATALLLLVAAS